MLSAAKFWKLGRLAILALVILMTRGLSISHAKDFILTPTADARVELFNPGTNYGTDKYLGVSSLFFLNGSYYAAKSYLKFDLSVIPASYRIIGGKLSIYCSGKQAITDVDLWAVPDTTWSEIGITWNNAPAVGPPITIISVGTGWNSWTIPKANLPATGLVSFRLWAQGIIQAPNSCSFYSKEYGSYPPQLTVTAVKKMAPAAINLLLLGN